MTDGERKLLTIVANYVADQDEVAAKQIGEARPRRATEIRRIIKAMANERLAELRLAKICAKEPKT